MKKYEKFTKDELSNFVKESSSYRELATKVGYCPDSGSASKSLKEMVEKFNLDTSHFLGQAWRKGEIDYSRFQKGKVIKLTYALPALIELRGHKCECCNLSEWLEKPITLEIHHRDGDRLNNTIENLELLCPNCHSQTDNWRGKNIKKTEIEEEKFVEALKNSPNIRQALLKIGLTAKGGNYNRARELINKYNIKHLM